MPIPHLELGPERNGFMESSGEDRVVWVGQREQLPWISYPGGPNQSLAYWTFAGPAWPDTTLEYAVQEDDPPIYEPGPQTYANGVFPDPATHAAIPLNQQSGNRWYRVTPRQNGEASSDTFFLYVDVQVSPVRLTWYLKGRTTMPYLWDNDGPGRTLELESRPVPTHVPAGIGATVSEAAITF